MTAIAMHNARRSNRCPLGRVLSDASVGAFITSTSGLMFRITWRTFRMANPPTNKQNVLCAELSGWLSAVQPFDELKGAANIVDLVRWFTIFAVVPLCMPYVIAQYFAHSQVLDAIAIRQPSPVCLPLTHKPVVFCMARLASVRPQVMIFAIQSHDCLA
jgi:hypothetical protein